MLIAEQKKRERETNAMIQQTELHFQVGFEIVAVDKRQSFNGDLYI